MSCGVNCPTKKGSKMAQPMNLRIKTNWAGNHSSKSARGLQIADYFNWAIFREWESGHQLSLKRIAPVINNQIEYFVRKAKYYYEYGVKK